MQPIIWRPPVHVATTDKDPVVLGGGFGWVSGSDVCRRGICVPRVGVRCRW